MSFDGNGMTVREELVPGHDNTPTCAPKNMSSLPVMSGSTTTTAQQYGSKTLTVEEKEARQEGVGGVEELIKQHTLALKTELEKHIEQRLDESDALNKKLADEVKRENEGLRQEIRDLRDEFDLFKRNNEKEKDDMRKAISEKEKRIDELQTAFENLKIRMKRKEESEEELLQENRRLRQEVTQLRGQLTCCLQDKEQNIRQLKRIKESLEK